MAAAPPEASAGSDDGRPRLLVLASTYPRWHGDHEPGFVHELSRRLVGRFDVTVLTSRSPGALPAEVMDGVKVLRYGYAPRRLETLVYGGGIATHLKRSPWKWLLVPGFVLGQWWALRRLVRQLAVDVVHAHWLIPQGWLARALRRRGGPPYVVTSHGGDLYGFRGRALLRLKRMVARDAAAMTVVSSGMRDEAVMQGMAAPVVRVIPMGADLQHRFTPDLSVPREAESLLFAGRLVEKKGLAHLIAALPAILQERPGVRLTIAGFGPLQDELESHARELGVEHAVRFLGATPQEQLPGLYRRATLLVAPFVRASTGDLEGLPVVLMEAIGCGCPVLASDIPGVRDLLGDGFDAWRVPPGDSQALARAVTLGLADPEQLRVRARALRERVRQKIDWDVISSEYADVLTSAHLAARTKRRGEGQ